MGPGTVVCRVLNMLVCTALYQSGMHGLIMNVLVQYQMDPFHFAENQGFGFHDLAS